MKKPATPPFRGIASNSPFWFAGSPFVPPESLSNCLVYDVTKDRPRMGSRPGCDEYFYGSFGGGTPIQGCGKVSRGKTPTGYSLGTGTDLPNSNGGTHTQGAVTGNIFRIDSSWGLEKYAYENVAAGGGFFENDGITAESGITHVPVTVLAISPDQTRIIVGETYADGSANTVCRITVRDASTLAVLWTKKMSDTGIDRRIYAVCANADWVFVATNHYVRIFKLSDGSNPANGASTNSMNGWSSVCVDVKASPDGNSLYALFIGSSGGTTLTGDGGGPVTVTAGIYAQHFRSGIMKFNIRSAALVAVSGETLTQTPFSPQLATDGSARYYEGNGTTKHNYLRFSEQMPWAPRGLRPVAMALRPASAGGGIAVVHANAAWGPNGTIGNPDYFPPDGSAGRWNLTTFTSAGIWEWHADGDSIFTEDGGAGFFNDLLNTTSRCIAVNANGDIFIAGRRTKPVGDADGFTAYAFDRYGDFLANQDLGALVKGICIMPSSQLIVAGGTRNDDWFGHGANTALWQMGGDDLSIKRTFPDLGGSAGVNAVAGIGFDGPVQPSEDRDSLAFVADWVG